MPSSPKNNTTSLFSSTCDTSRGQFLPYIAKEESHQVILPCSPKSENIVSCKNPDLATFLKEIDGLDFNTIAGKPISLPIPRFIPIMERGLFLNSAETIGYDVVGVSLEDIFSSSPQRRGNQIYIPQLRIREEALRSPIFKNKKVILFSSGRDVLIEKLWQDFHELNFPEVLSRMGVAVVTGINFSVFLDDCPLGKAVNMKKSLKSMEYFQEAGIETIPHIYFLHINHLQRWARWLQENPVVKTVAINCQFSRNRQTAINISDGIKFLTENTGREIHFLLEGPSQFLLREIHRLGCSSYIMIAIKKPSMDSIFGTLYAIERQKLTHKITKGLPMDKLLTPNFKIYEEYINRYIFESAWENVPTLLRTQRSSAVESSTRGK